MIYYAQIFHFYHQAFVRMIRLLLFSFLSFWLYINIDNGESISLPIFFISVLLQIEIFFKYKISRILPSQTVSQNDGKDLYSSCTIHLLEKVIAHQKTIKIIDACFHNAGVEFMLQRIPVDRKEIPLSEVPLENILQNAFTISKSTQGLYITTMDVVVSYLLFVEPNTKLLFNKKIKSEDLFEILKWARKKYYEEEAPKKKRVEFYGGGIGEALTTGWTPETKKYTQDYSYSAYKNKPQILGREKEFSQMLEVISKVENNNVLLVGNPGSGRENLVSLFAMESFLHTASIKYPHLKVLEVMIGPLIAGSANRAELETRLQAVIEEVSHSGNIVLYIPEFQNITGSSAYNIDLSGALYPYLRSGKTPIIASVTTGSFKSYIEKSSIVEAFTVINLLEPDKESTMRMILKKADDIEYKNNVILTYKALVAAVTYADRFFQDASLPGSAADLLENVSHSVSRNKDKNTFISSDKRPYIFDSHIIKAIQEKTHIALTAPEGSEKELLLNLEAKMHERVIDQEQAIVSIAESMRRLRAGLVTLKRPISFLFLGPTGVGKTETAKALSELYYGGEDKMIRLDMSEYADDDGVRRLLGALPGEGEERGELTDKIADRPASIVLLDEFEKAHPKIIDLFLQVLEDGRLTDNKGKTVSFVNSIVIATSNAGAEFIREEIKKGTAVDKDFSHRLLDYLQSQHLFRPELLNRFDEVVIFKPLGISEMEAIAKILLADLIKRLLEQDISFSYDEKLLQKIIKEGFDMQFGARPLRRYIQGNVEDIIAQKKLKDEIKRGSKVFMTTNDLGSINTVIST